MTSLIRDVRFGWRVLRKSPGQTAAAVLALALGIGLASAMFSIVYGALLRGLPFERADRLVRVWTTSPSRGQERQGTHLQDYLDWKRRQTSLAPLAAYYSGTINLSGDGTPERYRGAFLSLDLLPALGVRPLLGRGFLAGEDAPQAPPAVLLGYDLWKRRYGGDPKVLGRTVRVNGEAGTVVGVMAAGFGFPDDEELWLPLRLDPLRLQRGQGQELDLMGRLGDGVGVARAQAEFAAIARALAVEYPQTNQGVEAHVRPFMEGALGPPVASLLYTMLGACLFVLLIACTNVASLTMTRASRRTRELAIRAALGADRRAVIAQILVENLLLALLGTGLGLLLARWGIDLFNGVIADTHPPFWLRIAIDPTVVLFALALTLAAGLLSGLLPALQAAKTDLNEVLKDEGRGSSSLRLGRFSRWVVAVEVAVSCMLLIGAGLMIRNVVAVQRLDLGFDASRLLTARIALFEAAYPRPEDRARFFDRLLARLAARPGVVAAAAASSLPGNGGEREHYALDGHAYPAERDLPAAQVAVVSPGYFDALGVRAASGRLFGTLDDARALPVALVSASFAAKAWPGDEALGKRLRLVDPEAREKDGWRTVVGVVPDLQMANLNSPERSREGVYLPLAQRCPTFVSLLVRSAQAEPLALTAMVRREVTALDRDLPVYFVLSMRQLLAKNAFFLDLFGSLFAIFGACALALAAVGIYGVVASSVHQRTQEIGIRMALGAQRGSVLRLILSQGVRQLLLGLSCGLVLAGFVARLLGDVLVGVQPHDPATFAGVALLLALVALLACWLPAQRAAETEPLVAIRYE
jgi:putative ABC transport system permease protein